MATCLAVITAVETIYEPAPLGAWRVSVRFHNGGEATFAHTGLDAPRVGETWRLREPQLVECVEAAPEAEQVAHRFLEHCREGLIPMTNDERRAKMAAAVEAGAGYLDGRFPGWAAQVDLKRLDERGIERSLIAQVTRGLDGPGRLAFYGHEMGGDRFVELGFDGARPSWFGFTPSVPFCGRPDQAYAADEEAVLYAATIVMTALWAEQVVGRRGLR